MLTMDFLLLGRDGEPFLNLISVVPIRWKENDGEQKEYYVGFQADVRKTHHTDPSMVSRSSI